MVTCPGPAVSVIVPTFQRREYARRALASVFAQTYRDFEVIVVDDGSTDGTEEALAGLDPRLRYDRQENRGVSAARNAGLRMARGAIIAFLDSDDRWLTDHLDVVTEVFSRHPEVVLVSTCPGFQVGGRQQPSDARVFDALAATLTENVVGCQSGVAIRRAALVAEGGFDERLRVMEGSELWPRLAMHGPFATLRRRTIVRQATRGSLVERARRDGSYLRALALVAESAVATVSKSSRPDRAALIELAEGRAAYVAALSALATHDEETVRTQLEAACARLPGLSSQPLLVAQRISFLAADRSGYLDLLISAASSWPDQHCDTAVYLRMRALTGAVRAARLGTAGRLLVSWPPRPTPRFLLRSWRLWTPLARNAMHRRRHRGTEVHGLDSAAVTGR